MRVDGAELLSAYQASPLFAVWPGYTASFPHLPAEVIGDCLRHPDRFTRQVLALLARQPDDPLHAANPVEAAHLVVGRMAVNTFLPSSLGHLRNLIRGWRARKHYPEWLDEETVDEAASELAVSCLDQPYASLDAFAARVPRLVLCGDGYNALRRVIRQEIRRRSATPLDEEHTELSGGASAVEVEEVLGRLRPVLPATAWAVFELRELMSMDEVADTLGISRSQAYLLQQRAMELARMVAQRNGWE